MLETEIKKLREAIEANTTALLGKEGTNAPAQTATAAQPSAPAPAPTAAPTAPAAPATPAVPPTPAAAAAPVAPAATQAPVAPAPTAAPAGPQMNHTDAQQALAQIVQKLGAAEPVQAVMLKYGGNRLTDIPAESLFSMVTECQGLVA